MHSGVPQFAPLVLCPLARDSLAGLASFGESLGCIRCRPSWRATLRSGQQGWPLVVSVKKKRVHSSSRDGCLWGCDTADSLDLYVGRFPLRMVAGMFDDDAVFALLGIGVSGRRRSARTPQALSEAASPLPRLAMHFVPSGWTTGPSLEYGPSQQSVRPP